MPIYKINYRDPETDERKEVERDFEDSHDPHFISAYDWAYDWAYSLSDKNLSFTITEVTRKS